MKKLTLILALLGAVSLGAKAQTLADWTFEDSTKINSFASSPTTTGYGNPDTIGTNVASGNFNASGISATHYSGNPGTAAAGTNWSANSSYYLVTLTAAAGFTLDLTGLSFDTEGSGTGPKDFTVSYSTNGGASFTAFNTYTVGSSFSNRPFDLSSISDLSSVTSVEFKLLNSDATSINNGTVGSSGTDRIDNVVLSGTTVVAAPEPSTWALMAAGAALLVGLVMRRRAAATNI